MPEDSEQVVIGGPLCETCGELMTFMRATPNVGALPALETFRCIKCGDVRAIELEERPTRTPKAGIRAPHKRVPSSDRAGSLLTPRDQVSFRLNARHEITAFLDRGVRTRVSRR